MNTFDIIYSQEQATGYFALELQTYYHGTKLCGKLKQRLGITDDMEMQKIFKNIIAHKNPANPKEKLTPNKCQRLLFSFCVSAPKCFSILSIFLDDERLYEIHRLASEKAIDFLEKHAGVRKRENKRHDTKITGETLIFRCDHFLSRKNDPQLHSHEVFFNFTWDSEKKKFMALDPGLMGTLCPLATQIYRNALVRGMRGLGVAASISDKGEVQIDGITPELCKKYSKRKEEIEGLVANYEGSHKNEKCGKTFRAKVANARKDAKCSPAEEKLLLQKFREEIEESGWGDKLRDIVSPKKEPTVAMKILGYFQNKPEQIKQRNALDVLRDTEKKYFKDKSAVSWFKYQEAAMIEAKGRYTYEQISDAYNERIKNKEILITPTGGIVFKRIKTQNTNLLAEFNATRSIKRQVPYTLSDLSEAKDLPVAKRLLQNDDSVVFVEEEKEDEYSDDLKLFAECANKIRIPVFYLNAHRATKRKRVCNNDERISKNRRCTKSEERSVAKALTFNGLSTLKDPALIIVDNAGFIEPDYMLKLLRVTKRTKSKLLLVTRKNDRKIDSIVDSLGLLKANGLKPITEINATPRQSVGIVRSQNNIQTTYNCLIKYRYCYDAKIPAKFVCLSEAEKATFKEYVYRMEKGRLKENLIEIYPNISRHNGEIIVFASDKCPALLFAEISTVKDKKIHLFKTEPTKTNPPKPTITKNLQGSNSISGVPDQSSPNLPEIE